jgi:hypothetical protein
MCAIRSSENTPRKHTNSQKERKEEREKERMKNREKEIK